MTDSAIDLETWGTMKSMTDAAFLVELVDMYLLDSPELIEQMHAGLNSSDCEIVRRAAHTLKSNSASLGANRLAGFSRELEMTAKGNTLLGAESKLALVETEYAQVVAELEELKK